MSDKMWMVRAEVGGKRFSDFQTRSLVAIGWAAAGDPTALVTRAGFKAAIAGALPTASRGYMISSASQLYRFVREININDRVVAYGRAERCYMVGRITGGYKYDPSILSSSPNTRTVSWEGQVARDRLSSNTRMSLGSIQALFVVPDRAVRELLGFLSSQTSRAS